MKWRPIAGLFVLGLLASSAAAQGNLTPPQILRHDASITGAGTSASPAGVHVATGGGLTTNGGTTGVGLSPCSTGQVWQSTGSAWACADNASTVAGTLGHIPFYTPDGAHLGDTPAIYDSTTAAGTAPLTAIGTISVPVHNVNLGGGEPAGNPTYTTTAVDNGVGLLSAGDYRWAYYEADVDPALSTGLSPASSPLTLAASHQALVTTGQVRRGMAGRILCRTKVGGSIFYAVHSFGGGTDFFDTQWVDNTPDSSLVTLCPTVDTTKVYAVQVTNNGVKWFRTHPSIVGPADSGSMTSDPLVAGSYVYDHYGPGLIRTINGTNLGLLKTGRSGYGILAAYTTGTGLDTGTGYDPGNSLTRLFFMGDQGTIQISPNLPLIDAGLGLSTVDRRAISVTATLPAIATTTNEGVNIDIISNGSSAFSQRAMTIQLEANYNGSATTEGLSVTNAAASTGLNVGVKGNANGVGFQNVGTTGFSSQATHNVGLYGGFVTMPTNGVDAAIYADNASTTKDLFLGTDSRSGHVTMFEVTGDGSVWGAGTGSTADGTIVFQPGTNATATGWLSFYSYSPGNVRGTTQFRDTKIGNGKGAAIVTVTGSTNAVDIVGAVTADAGLRIFDVASSGLASTANAVRLNINSGSTQTCGAGTAVTVLTTLGLVTCSTFGSSSLTNAAGNNVIPKSDGTNLVASSLLDNTTTVSTTENVSIGTASGVGKLSILSADVGSGAGGAASGAWGTTYALFGPNVASTTGAALGLGYSTTDSAAKIVSAQPGTAWKGIDFYASTFRWFNNNTQKASFDGTTFAITGGLTTTTTIVATGNITGSALIAGTTNAIGWGDLTTKIAGSNSGAGSGSMQFNTNSTVRGKVDNAGLWTFGPNSADAPGATGTTVIVSNLGTTCSEVRDSTNDVEAEHCASSSGTFFGSQTNHSTFIQTNNTNAIKVDTSQLVTVLKTLTVGPGSDVVAAAGSAGSWQNNGATSMSVRDATDDVEIALVANNLGVQLGSTTNHALNVITNGTAAIQVDTSQNSKFLGHIIGGSGTPSVSSGGGCGTSPSIAGNDNFGKITVGGSTSSCVLTFAIAYATHEPACSATSTSANSNISISAAAAGSVTFSQASPSMSGTTFYYSCGGY